MTHLSAQDKKDVIKKVETYVQKLLAKEKAAHDWYHINHVRIVALKIAKQEGADAFLTELMALLHEGSDRKIVGEQHAKKALLKLHKFLADLNISEDQIEEIIYVIDNQSYSKSGISGQKLDSLAGLCMQDADRLEAIGAIGMARCFAYNGKLGNPIHDPTILPREKIDAKEYKKDIATSINHFYEKLLKLKDLMNTKEGKKLAANRHKFMENFLKEFYAEWDGLK